MKVNVEKVLERDQKLSQLDDRAGESNSINRLATDFLFVLTHLYLRCPPGRSVPV